MEKIYQEKFTFDGWFDQGRSYQRCELCGHFFEGHSSTMKSNGGNEMGAVHYKTYCDVVCAEVRPDNLGCRWFHVPGDDEDDG